MPNSIATVATVLVTWNQTDLTLDCLASLEVAGVAQPSIWVVDNGSDPACGPAILARFPTTNHLRLPANRGFAGGVNAGVAAALERAPDAVLLLNNDALIEPQTLPALRAALDGDPAIGAASPKVYYAGSQRVIQSTGLRVNPETGRGAMLASNEPDCGQHDQPADREALFGCAMLIRRAAWDQAGPLWDPFFNYAEETDWCLRARRAGWRLRYVPEGVVWHRTSSSLGWDSPLKTYLIHRNQLWLRSRNATGHGWRRLSSGARVAAQFARIAFGFARRRRWRHVRAVALAAWDFRLGRAGNSRDSRLRLVSTCLTVPR